jgi:hypothetical protein
MGLGKLLLTRQECEPLGSVTDGSQPQPSPLSLPVVQVGKLSALPELLPLTRQECEPFGSVTEGSQPQPSPLLLPLVQEGKSAALATSAGIAVTTEQNNTILLTKRIL